MKESAEGLGLVVFFGMCLLTGLCILRPLPVMGFDVGNPRTVALLPCFFFFARPCSPEVEHFMEEFWHIVVYFAHQAFAE